jgi:hypothetical protein
VVARMVARLCGMSCPIAPSVPVPAGSARAVLVGAAVAAVVLLQLGLPAVSLAQSESADAIRWQGTVKYTEVARSPEGHRVKNIEIRFQLLTPLISTTDYDEGYVWNKVVIAYADRGRWHYDESEVDGGWVPETNNEWSISDTLTDPSGRIERLTAGEIHTKRGDGSVEEVRLPTLPVRRVGSTVLVQPNGIGLRLDVTYGKAIATFRPKSGIRDRGDLEALFFAKQPPHVPGEGIAVDGTASEDYAGLPPEIAAQLKMLEAMSNGGEFDDDQVAALAALQMDGFVEYDGGTVSGSREWTTSAADPGEYTGSLMDEQTSVSHELVWSFVPMKGN